MQPTWASCSMPRRTPSSRVRLKGAMKMNELKSATKPATRRLLEELEQHRGFVDRHIGTSESDQREMLETLGYPSRAALIDAVVPPSIRSREPLPLSAAKGEEEALDLLKAMARRNRIVKSYIGQGYYGTLTPPVIRRNVLENPAWYTAYTPYQPEISQGRLEALVNFQTMVCDLTGMAIANASMLDEATAAAEAMTLVRRISTSKSARFFVADDVFPQTIDVIRTRAAPLGIDVPIGFGGPHAGYLATRDALKRSLPGRLVGVTVDAQGAPAYRLALQTREQHIRREKATSNICTAQVLLAVIASMYAVYHGPDGLAAIAARVHRTATRLAAGLRAGGVDVAHEAFFDTVTALVPGQADEVVAAAADRGVNLRLVDVDRVGIACDETTTEAPLRAVGDPFDVSAPAGDVPDPLPAQLRRGSAYLTHPVFTTHRSETALLRYLRRL